MQRYEKSHDGSLPNGHELDVIKAPHSLLKINANGLQDPNIVRLLWTSGWDSTFRLLQLVVEKQVTVLPIYIITDRDSTHVEIKAIDRIKKLTFKLFPQAASRILPTLFFDVHDLPEYPEITAKHNALLNKSYLGSQYRWLCKFAKYFDINDLELSIHRDDTAYEFVKGFVVKNKNQHGEYYSLDPAIDDSNPLSLFKPFRLPMLEWTKVAMKDHATKTGTIEIMNLTWFCHIPINGEPCGTCNPCRYTIQEGMAYRLPKKALARYRANEVYRKFGKKYPVAFKVFNKLKGK